MSQLIPWVLFLLLGSCAAAAELRLPQTVEAGSDLAFTAPGSGDATLYLVGPGTAIKRKARLGEETRIEGSELKDAGRYILLLRDGAQASASFWVVPGKADALSFMARPSRVPVAEPEGITAVVFAFDRYQNLLREPTPVKVELSLGGAAPLRRTGEAREGVAWMRMESSSRGGLATLSASVGDVTEKRVVQQVASTPCNLRIHARRTEKAVLVETDPVRDCSGNAVPDGTIVSFTMTGRDRRSTVDAPIKRGIARAELPPLEGATISVASGVAMGNEIRLGGGQ